MVYVSRRTSTSYFFQQFFERAVEEIICRTWRKLLHRTPVINYINSGFYFVVYRGRKGREEIQKIVFSLYLLFLILATRLRDLLCPLATQQP